ncbi:transglutaminase family protein [Paludibaculum fermentans]|uniref:transglutaminase family protein n=1 Tax=Paludibaculum fermentans TaxID=1473598 RepID=UPI003EBF38EA
MRISVEHSTVYRYDFPVCLQPHTFRLRPRTNSTQRLLSFDMRITPAPAGTTECLDQDGNLALNAWFDSTTDSLTVRSRFRIEMLRDNPFDFAHSEASLNLPLWYLEPLCTALASYRLDGHVSEAVKQYAKVLAAGAQWNSLAFLSALNQQIFLTCRHITRPDGAPWSSDQTLAAREGSCRDLAVLFCDICRVMGIAARFVSGYECAAAGGAESYMHAWAEVYLPSAGWRGYDPSRGLVVSNAHVAVAAGFDHNLAAPIAGVFSGGISSGMEASIEMHVEPDATP